MEILQFLNVSTAPSETLLFLMVPPLRSQQRHISFIAYVAEELTRNR